MARSGRSYTNRAVIARHPRTFDRLLTLAPFESVSEWPAIDVTTPNVNLFLPTFESVSEWPANTFIRDQNLVLPAFESASEWPALAITIPVKPGDSLTGADGQVEWNGVLWGPTTNVKVLLPVEGWYSTPGIDNLNVARPSRHGAWDARKLAQQRIVSIRLQLDSAADPTQVQTLIDQILAATGIPEDDTPLPLVIKAYGPPKLAYGQVVDRPMQLDGDYNVGLPTIGVVVACADPRLYDLERQGVTVPLSTPTTLNNAGNASTGPLIRLEGPVVNPVLVNSRLTRTLQFTLTVNDGDLLEIDTDNGTATVGGDNVMSTLTGGVPVTDFVLAAGSNPVTFTATSGGSNGADFLWRHAVI